MEGNRFGGDGDESLENRLGERFEAGNSFALGEVFLLFSFAISPDEASSSESSWLLVDFGVNRANSLSDIRSLLFEICLVKGALCGMFEAGSSVDLGDLFLLFSVAVSPCKPSSSESS